MAFIRLHSSARSVILLAVLSLLGAALLVTTHSSGTAGAASTASRRPNIITIMTDDQDLASVKYLPTVQKLAKQGVTFSQHTASYSLCCPSRSTYLTGQLAHNHGVRGNFAPYGGYNNLNKDEVLPVWLEKAGYNTAHLGKYLNGYNVLADPTTRGVPKGWTEWYGALDPVTYLYYNYALNENGKLHFYGQGEKNYQTDVLTRKAVDFIDRRAPESKPFFLDVSYLASHFAVKPGSDLTEVGILEGGTDNEPILGVPPVPAKRHQDLFTNLKAPRPPSYNEADVSDKPASVRKRAKLTTYQQKQVDRWYQRRLQSLQAVDDGLGKILQALKRTGELDNTYIIFTSDNGYQLGEHRIWLNKVDHYEPSTRLPLIVTGPGVKAGGKVHDWTSNVDIHATILDLAKASRPGATFPLDGASLKPYLAKPTLKTGRIVVHEAYNTFGLGKDPEWQGIRVGRWKWIEYANGERELYDVVNDPYELTSRHADPRTAALRAKLEVLYDKLAPCVGKACIARGYAPYWDKEL